MLTLKQIIKLYQEGVEIKFIKKPHPDCLKGEFDPSNLEILVYLSHADSKTDKDLTILHELVHARNNQKNNFAIDSETYVEQEAVMTYYKRGYILDFIKVLYAIKD